MPTVTRALATLTALAVLAHACTDLAEICGRTADEESTIAKRVVNGTRTSVAKHPWLVRLHRLTVYIDESDNKIDVEMSACGGSIIDETTVLTAHHCVSSKEELSAKNSTVVANTIIVHYGTDSISFPDYNSMTEAARHATATNVACVWRAHVAKLTKSLDTNASMHAMVGGDIHMLGDSMTDGDISVIKLPRALKWSSSVRPICMPTANDTSYHGSGFTVVGRGVTMHNVGEDPSDASDDETTSTEHVLEANVSVLNPCILNILGVNMTVDALKDKAICTTDTTLADGHSVACSGDSGGPLEAVRDGRTYIVGVASLALGPTADQSYGYKCRDGMNVWAYVPSYIDWVESFMRA